MMMIWFFPQEALPLLPVQIWLDVVEGFPPALIVDTADDWWVL